MALRLNPYLKFDGDAAEAMAFYQEVFGGELTVSSFGDFEESRGVEGVMHAQLETDAGFTLMASDTPPGMEFTPGANYSVSLSGDDAETLHRHWTALASGAQVGLPLQKQMWGDEFGMLIDRFGTPWMVNITAPR